MKLILKLKIPGNPVAKGRPRMGRRHAYTPKTTRAWEDKFVRYATRIWPSSYVLDGPLGLRVLAVKKRPKNKMGKKYPDGRMHRMVKPDGDNVLKIVGDALQKANVIADDKFIVKWYIHSLYGSKLEEGAVYIKLYRIVALGVTWNA